MALLGIIQANVIHNVAGRETTNTLYFNHTQDGGLSLENTLNGLQSAIFDTLWSTHWKPILSIRAKLVAISCAPIYPTPLPGYAYPYIDEFGAINTDTIPTNAACLISFKSATTPRNFNRRLYLAGLPESEVNDSRVSLALFASLTALGQQIRATITLPNFPTPDILVPVAFSYKRAIDMESPVFEALGSVVVTVPTRTQRNRALRLG